MLAHECLMRAVNSLQDQAGCACTPGYLLGQGCAGALCCQDPARLMYTSSCAPGIAWHRLGIRKGESVATRSPWSFAYGNH